MKKAAFLDRDGVINRKAPEGQYVMRWKEMELLPGAFEAIRLLNAAGFLVVVVTNQRCVAKGLITPQELESLHARMLLEFQAAGARIDGVYYCPHDYKHHCACRKPQPGMLLDAARDHNIQFDASWMIGDSDHDVQAGHTAGCKTARIVTDQQSTHASADIVATSLLDATHKILQIH
jgi:D-glycero-D-manno-heptose 1,7-bisphosphate phosphatase